MQYNQLTNHQHKTKAMSEITFKIKKRGDNFIACDANDKTKEYGKLNIKTEKCVGGTHCFEALREHFKAYKATAKITYKIWMVVEETVTYPDGTVIETDLTDNTQSAGNFSTLEEADSQLGKIADYYGGDFTESEE